MTFRILLTNDDGINAPGLKVAEEIAHKVAGKDGEVITVAPAIDQSGVGHSISYLRPSLIYKYSQNRYSVEGSPADCVLAGIYHVMKGCSPNLIISGVNKGHNLSEDILYSGTVGAAMEGALQGIKSIAISQCYSKKSLLFDDYFESARNLAPALCEQLLHKAAWDQKPYQTFYNINFPPVKTSKIKGTMVCKQDKRAKGSFSMESIQSPNGRTFLMVNHKPNTQNQTTHKKYKSDTESINDNYVTVTPLKADLTSYAELTKLETIINNDF